MTLDALPRNASLAAVLHDRALSSTARRLVADCVVGSAAVALALWWRPMLWLQLMSAGLCLAAYGIWAFAERRLDDDTAELAYRAEMGWGAVRGLAAGIGLLAAVLFACSIAAATLGTWIS